MTAYYNEHDSFKAAWLRELIHAGLIAPGEVDERSIEDVIPNELVGFTQCHFFAGIGVWSYALRCAGWPDDRPVWTGSCPCQPFSTAGKRAGTADERHLWPAWFWLISQQRPETVFAEQVAIKDGLAWLDLVSADLAGAGYTWAATDLCAAGFGGPHIRQRLFIVADTDKGGPQGRRPSGIEPNRHTADEDLRSATAEFCSTGTLADTAKQRHDRRRAGEASGWREPTREQPKRLCVAGPANGFWADAIWLPCKDGKARAVEPGTFPLAHGAPARVGRLRGYGDAIVAPVAIEFIRAYLETET